MRAFVMDRAERTVGIERVRRDGNVIFRSGMSYAIKGVTWAWRAPAFPRLWFAITFIPIIGPILFRKIWMMDTSVFLVEGIPTVFEPRTRENQSYFEPVLTDKEAFAVMEAYADVMAIGKQPVPWAMLFALGVVCVIALGVASLIL